MIKNREYEYWDDDYRKDSIPTKSDSRLNRHYDGPDVDAAYSRLLSDEIIVSNDRCYEPAANHEPYQELYDRRLAQAERAAAVFQQAHPDTINNPWESYADDLRSGRITPLN